MSTSFERRVFAEAFLAAVDGRAAALVERDSSSQSSAGSVAGSLPSVSASSSSVFVIVLVAQTGIGLALVQPAALVFVRFLVGYVLAVVEAGVHVEAEVAVLAVEPEVVVVVRREILFVFVARLALVLVLVRQVQVEVLVVWRRAAASADGSWKPLENVDLDDGAAN